MIIEQKSVITFKLNSPNISVSYEGDNIVGVHIPEFNVFKKQDFNAMVEFLIEVNKKINQ